MNLLAICLLPSCLASPAVQDPPAEPFDAEAALRRVLEEPHPVRRAKQATQLAAKEPSVDAWLAVLADVSKRPAVRPTGDPNGTEQVWPLWDGKNVIQAPVRVFVPNRQRQAEPMPMVVGGGNNGSAVFGHHIATARELGMVIVGVEPPEGTFGHGFLESERQFQLSAMREAKRRYHIDANKIFHSGHSRGGTLTWDVALRHPDHFAGLLAMTGGPRLTTHDGQNNMRLLENVAHISIRDLQGSLDDPLLLANLRLSFEKLHAYGAKDAKLVEFPRLEHSWRWEGIDWPAWFRSAQRESLPKRVVRMTDKKGEGRAFWVSIDRVDRSKVKQDFRLKVKASEWNSMDADGRRRLAAKAAEDRTARLVAELVRPGVITVQSKRVKSFSLLLTPEMLDAKGKVVVKWNGRSRRKTPKPDAAVLLRDYAERLDPGFLPTMRVKF